MEIKQNKNDGVVGFVNTIHIDTWTVFNGEFFVLIPENMIGRKLRRGGFAKKTVGLCSVVPEMKWILSMQLLMAVFYFLFPDSTVWCYKNKPDIWASQMVPHLRGDWLHWGGDDGLCSITGSIHIIFVFWVSFF